MKKMFLMLAMLLSLASCGKINDAIDALDNRVTKLEGTIPSIQQQIANINKSITDLEDVDAALKEHIAELEKNDTATSLEIAALKVKNVEIQQNITDLKLYITELNQSANDWVIATFATLEQYNSLATDLTNIKAAIDENADTASSNLADAIATLENSMKEWVGEQLANYYTIAEVDAKVTAIEKQIKDGDDAITSDIEELKASLETAKTDLTTAYKEAIEEAITTNNGVIDGKIAKEIETINKRIDDDLETINTKITAIEERLDALEDKVDDLTNNNDLSITFDVADNSLAGVNTTFQIGYTIESYIKDITIDVISSADIVASVEDVHAMSGKIEVSTGSTLTQNSKIIVFVSNGEKVIMRRLSFEQAALQVVDNATKNIAIGGGGIVLEFMTNTECNAIIPDDAKSWLSIAPSTRVVEKHSITLQVADNSGNASRSTDVIVKSITGGVEVKYTIEQDGVIKELAYTTNDGKPLDPYRTDGFGADFIENVYDTTTGKGSLKFDGNVTTIPANAFAACRNLSWIDIPNSITQIGDRALYNCPAIETIYIPESVVSIGLSSFEGCGGEATIDCQIGANYFQAAKFTKVTISDNITTIGESAFLDCTYLKDVYYTGDISQWCKITFKDSKANPLFYSARLYIGGLEVTDVSIPLGLTEIKDYTFVGCSGLKIVTIPEGVTTIGTGAFGKCAKLTDITIPESVTTIKDHAFQESSGITSIVIPNKVLRIEYGTFAYCSALKDVTIGSRVSSIGEYAFGYCDSLTSITIPDSVASIGDYAFRYCSSLKSVYCKPTTPPIAYFSNSSWWAFRDTSSELKIYVPASDDDSVINAYKNANGWRYYKADIEEADFE